MLCSEDHTIKARVFSYLDPLGGIETGRVEHRRVNLASTPLRVCKGIGSKVKEECH